MVQDEHASALYSELDRALQSSSAGAQRLADVLRITIEHFGCSAGTLHVIERGNEQLLTLAADHGIPDVVLQKIQSVPLGKGIAGLAAQQAAPVQLCNLQTDTSGVARPGAKDTQVAGSLAVPIMAGDRVVGTLGIGKRVPYEFTQPECETLMQVGRLIAKHLPE
jgi:signal transduction protein with GAF and PtsI domain